MRSFICSSCLAWFVFAIDVFGSVTVFYNGLNHPAARQAWMQTAAPFTTIDFTGFAENTIITNQYQSAGLTFTDGTDRVNLNDSFPNDGSGLYGAIDSIHLAFAQPTYSIAVDFPGSLRIALYWQGAVTYTSPDFVNGGTGFFAGLISDQPFDAAIIIDPTGGVFIDDLFFGPPIPAPATFAAMLLAALVPHSRRRSRTTGMTA